MPQRIVQITHVSSYSHLSLRPHSLPRSFRYRSMSAGSAAGGGSSDRAPVPRLSIASTTPLMAASKQASAARPRGGGGGGGGAGKGKRKPKTAEQLLKICLKKTLQMTGFDDSCIIEGRDAHNRRTLFRVVSGGSAHLAPSSTLISEAFEHKSIEDRMLKELGCFEMYADMTEKERLEYLFRHGIEGDVDLADYRASDELSGDAEKLPGAQEDAKRTTKRAAAAVFAKWTPQQEIYLELLHPGDGEKNDLFKIGEENLQRLMTPGAVFSASEIRAMIPRKPGSNPKKPHTLFFKRKHWCISRSVKTTTEFKGLVLDACRGRYLEGGYTISPDKEKRKIMYEIQGPLGGSRMAILVDRPRATDGRLSLEALLDIIDATPEFCGKTTKLQRDRFRTAILRVLRSLNPSDCKSGAQKNVRYRPETIDVEVILKCVPEIAAEIAAEDAAEAQLAAAIKKSAVPSGVAEEKKHGQQAVLDASAAMKTKHHLDSRYVLCVFLAVLVTHPGAFVPDIQRYVSGVEAAAKRMVIIMAEDARIDADNVTEALGMTIAAFLSYHVRLWKPTFSMVTSWMHTAVETLNDPCTVPYNIERGGAPEMPRFVLPGDASLLAEEMALATEQQGKEEKKVAPKRNSKAKSKKSESSDDDEGGSSEGSDGQESGQDDDDASDDDAADSDGDGGGKEEKEVKAKGKGKTKAKTKRKGKGGKKKDEIKLTYAVAKTKCQYVSALMDEIKSFSSDLSMIRDIAGSHLIIKRDVELESTPQWIEAQQLKFPRPACMPFAHICDMHNVPNMSLCMEPSVFGEVAARLRDEKVSGPRKTHVSNQKRSTPFAPFFRELFSKVTGRNSRKWKWTADFERDPFVAQVRLGQTRYLQRKLQQMPLDAEDSEDDDSSEDSDGDADMLQANGKGKPEFKQSVSKQAREAKEAKEAMDAKAAADATTWFRDVYVVDYGNLAGGLGTITFGSGQCKPYLATVFPEAPAANVKSENLPIIKVARVPVVRTTGKDSGEFVPIPDVDRRRVEQTARLLLKQGGLPWFHGTDHANPPVAAWAVQSTVQWSEAKRDFLVTLGKGKKGKTKPWEQLRRVHISIPIRAVDKVNVYAPRLPESDVRFGTLAPDSIALILAEFEKLSIENRSAVLTLLKQYGKTIAFNSISRDGGGTETQVELIDVVSFRFIGLVASLMPAVLQPNAENFLKFDILNGPMLWLLCSKCNGKQQQLKRRQAEEAERWYKLQEDADCDGDLEMSAGGSGSGSGSGSKRKQPSPVVFKDLQIEQPALKKARLSLLEGKATKVEGRGDVKSSSMVKVSNKKVERWRNTRWMVNIKRPEGREIKEHQDDSGQKVRYRADVLGEFISFIWMTVGCGKTAITPEDMMKLLARDRRRMCGMTRVIYVTPKIAMSATVTEFVKYGFDENSLSIAIPIKEVHPDIANHPIMSKYVHHMPHSADATRLDQQFRPFHVTLIDYDHLRVCSEALFRVMPTSKLVLDEMHLAMNTGTIRTGLCQRLVPAACEAILKTGTAVINSKAFHLSMWLQHCLSWHLTPANFMVAVGSCMIAKLQQLDIQVKHHTVTAEWTSEAQQNEYKKLVPLRLDGIRETRASDKERKRAEAISFDAVTVAQVSTVEHLLTNVIKPGEPGVYVIARNRAHQAELRKLLLARISGGNKESKNMSKESKLKLSPKDVLVLGQMSVEHTDDSVAAGSPDYRVIIGLLKGSLGFNLSRIRHIVTSFYFGAFHNYIQANARVVRTGQKSKVVDIFTVLSRGLLMCAYTDKFTSAKKLFDSVASSADIIKS